MSLQGKVILITGGSKGIGRAIALRVAKSGASVVVNYSSDSNAANEVVSQIGSDRALAVKADASTVTGVSSLVDATVKQFGKVDVVIPNAGMMPMQDLEHTTEATFDKIYAINVKGPYFLAQKAVPHMPSGGRIIFVSTGIAHNSAVPPPYLLYASTKGAVEQMTRVMAKDLGKKGITVNCVAPGPTATELFFEGKSEAMVKGIASQSPFNRLGDPAEIAELAAFVAGPESRWVSGQVIGANGAAFV
ncbi:hypothetical protein MGN70_005857 [Eutypa lata]|uniref:Putative short-chain dehydrogenase reductase protein n=1 Tax=Eutypa lata (strain UCR-EL1) TaxID=1287681 RepID=M7SGK3_EUTLA|nr:putative short-chain dehydrogenase reductase protein [Eutypa lata UCREL1]KAI1251291.1 hypothetical protein MGN70_005857 [Eutypa lata]